MPNDFCGLFVILISYKKSNISCRINGSLVCFPLSKHSRRAYLIVRLEACLGPWWVYKTTTGVDAFTPVIQQASPRLLVVMLFIKCILPIYILCLASSLAKPSGK